MVQTNAELAVWIVVLTDPVTNVLTLISYSRTALSLLSVSHHAHQVTQLLPALTTARNAQFHTAINAQAMDNALHVLMVTSYQLPDSVSHHAQMDIMETLLLELANRVHENVNVAVLTVLVTCASTHTIWSPVSNQLLLTMKCNWLLVLAFLAQVQFNAHQASPSSTTLPTYVKVAMLAAHSATITVHAHSNVQVSVLTASAQLITVLLAQETKFWFNLLTAPQHAESNAMMENSTTQPSRLVLAVLTTAQCATTLSNAFNAIMVSTIWVHHKVLAQSANVWKHAHLASMLMTMEIANNAEKAVHHAQVLIPAMSAMTSLTWLTELVNVNSTMRSLPDQPSAILISIFTILTSMKLWLRRTHRCHN